MFCGIAATPTADRYGKPVSFQSIILKEDRGCIIWNEISVGPFLKAIFFSSKECTNNSSTFEGVTAGLLRVQVFWDVNLLACHPVVFYNVKAQVFFFTQHYFIVKQIAFIFIASCVFRLLYQSRCHVKYKSNHSSVVRREISLTYIIYEWYNVSLMWFWPCIVVNMWK
jgi:hypothetical protein